jgi:hypothetical protein
MTVNEKRENRAQGRGQQDKEGHREKDRYTMSRNASHSSKAPGQKTARKCKNRNSNVTGDVQLPPRGRYGDDYHHGHAEQNHGDDNREPDCIGREINQRKPCRIHAESIANTPALFEDSSDA